MVRVSSDGVDCGEIAIAYLGDHNARRDARFAQHVTHMRGDAHLTDDTNATLSLSNDGDQSAQAIQAAAGLGFVGAR